MFRSTYAATVIALCFAGTSAAQPPSQASSEVQPPARSFGQLRFHVKVGDTVDIVEVSDVKTRGRVAALSDGVLALVVDRTRREFAASDVRYIEHRRHDSIRNGLLIGLGAGAALGFALGRAADSPSCPRPGIECGQGAVVGTIGGAVWGAAGGWIADALIRKREVVYVGDHPRAF
jgi:hypothetical protein